MKKRMKLPLHSVAIVCVIAASCAGCCSTRPAESTQPPHTIEQDLTGECLSSVQNLNRLAEFKFEQMRLAREKDPAAFAALNELYPAARDAYNAKVRWIRSNGPQYPNPFAPRSSDPLGPTDTGYTENDIDPAAKEFFVRLRDITMPRPPIHSIENLAWAQNGEMMPAARMLLDRLRTQCRSVTTQDAVKRWIDPMRFPETLDEIQ
jgi:hypothetical protein